MSLHTACPEQSDTLVLNIVGLVAIVTVAAALAAKFRALLPMVIMRLCINYCQGT